MKRCSVTVRRGRGKVGGSRKTGLRSRDTCTASKGLFCNQAGSLLGRGEIYIGEKKRIRRGEKGRRQQHRESYNRYRAIAFCCFLFFFSIAMLDQSIKSRETLPIGGHERFDHRERRKI